MESVTRDELRLSCSSLYLFGFLNSISLAKRLASHYCCHFSITGIPDQERLVVAVGEAKVGSVGIGIAMSGEIDLKDDTVSRFKVAL